MNIGVIGGGAIGMLISSYLAKEHNITLYVRRDEQKKHINKHGLSIVSNVPSFAVNVQMIEQLHEADILFVCVKQTDIQNVIKQIKDSNIKAPLVFLQNGMGHLSFVKQLSQDVYLGVVEHGAKRKTDFQVEHTGNGKINIALLKGNSKQLTILVNNLTKTNFPFIASPDWNKMLTKKLVINAVINPLTALFNIKNGYILENKNIQRLAKELCKEASTQLDLNFNEEWSRVETIAKSTANNTSSMLADLKANKKTENEAISGYLLQNSKTELPYTSFVYNSVEALEAKNGIN